MDYWALKIVGIGFLFMELLFLLMSYTLFLYHPLAHGVQHYLDFSMDVGGAPLFHACRCLNFLNVGTLFLNVNAISCPSHGHESQNPYEDPKHDYYY